MGIARIIRRTSLVVVAATAVALSASASASAAADAGRQWANWRGPLHTGEAPHADPPVRWSETENVRWKVAIPGRGLASPIVWEDRVFVMTSVAADAAAYDASRKKAADKQERNEWPPSVEPVAQRFVLVALSRADGRVLWERVAREVVPHESHYIDSSWASGSPVTDGKRVIAHFGSFGTYAYDLDGNLLWSVDLGDMTTRNGFGEGSSPALHGDTVVINWDHEGDSFVVALDAATGKERWRTPRPGEVTSWATPLVVRVGDRDQVVVPATGNSRGYDLETGREVWSLEGMTVNTIPSPVEVDGIVYLTSGYRGNMLQAVALAGATGDLEESAAVRFRHDRDTPYVPSLLLTGGRIYMIKHFKGILSVLDATTGEVRYQTRLPEIDSIWSSPVAAAGRVYVFGRDGSAVVLEDGDTFEVLARNTLDDGVDATPALVGGELFVRTRGHVYCIANAAAETAGER